MSYGDGEVSTYEPEEDRPGRRTRPKPGPIAGDALSGRQQRLWEVAETLDNALETLTQRVGPVLSPEAATTPISALDGDREDRSELGAFLDQLTDRLRSLGRRTSALSERIDL
jgi:hypothetical protein